MSEREADIIYLNVKREQSEHIATDTEAFVDHIDALQATLNNQAFFLTDAVIATLKHYLNGEKVVRENFAATADGTKQFFRAIADALETDRHLSAVMMNTLPLYDPAEGPHSTIKSGPRSVDRKTPFSDELSVGAYMAQSIRETFLS